jgi:hypothetical protein
MKTLSFNDNAGLTVNYLTDLIDGIEQFTVLQIITVTNGVEIIGLTDAVIQMGGDMIQVGKCYMIEDFIEYATVARLNLIETSDEHPDPVWLVDNR